MVRVYFLPSYFHLIGISGRVGSLGSLGYVSWSKCSRGGQWYRAFIFLIIFTKMFGFDLPMELQSKEAKASVLSGIVREA